MKIKIDTCSTPIELLMCFWVKTKCQLIPVSHKVMSKEYFRKGAKFATSILFWNAEEQHITGNK